MIGVTGSNGSARSVFITDGVSLVGKYDAPSSNATLTEATITYTGPATKLYMYNNASVALYYMSATNVELSTGVNQISTEKDITFNGKEITNSKGLSLEVYNVLGKRVVSSTISIPTSNLSKGIYIVRVAGSNESLKFSI